MEGKIVYQAKISEQSQITIRYPNSSDVELMTNYINTLSDERTFISYQGEKETLETEMNFLNSKLEKIRTNKAVMLLAFAGNSLVGVAGVELGTKINRHTGALHISVAKTYRGKGVGRLLMEYLLKESKERLEELEILILGVFSNNSLAINWYKSLGFVEEGRLPNGVKLENGYVDHIYMYKMID